jgi:ABC-2 type transport system permease protein
MSTVLIKTLRDQKVSGPIWIAGVLAISAYVMMLYPIIANDPNLTSFIQNLPQAMKAIFGGQLDYSTANSFLSAQLYSVIAPIILIVYGVSQGVGAIAGEEERGTLGLLLSCPVPRRSVLLQKAAAMAAGVAALAATLWAGLLFFGMVRGVSIDVSGLAYGTLSLALVSLFFGAMGLAVGAATGRRGVATGAVVGFAVATYLLNAFLNLVDWLWVARFITPFYYYSGNAPLTHGLSVSHALVLSGAVIVLIAASVWGFERRDLVK